jgi:hypothetical protein
MIVTCEKRLFDLFLAAKGSWLTLKGDDLDFLYLALGKGLEFADRTLINIPELQKKHLKAWDKFEYWCEEIRQFSMWKLVDENDLGFLHAYENSSPLEYFGSERKIMELVIDRLTRPDDEANEPVMYVEIECESTRLFLIYEPSDGWGLGHNDTVAVVGSLEELDESWGFYKLQIS